MATVYSTNLDHFEPRARPLMEIHPQDDGTDEDNLASSAINKSRYNTFIKDPLKGDEVWIIREVSNGEEELYAKGKCVYWTRNSLIIKSFNFTDQVVRVLWTRFNKCDHVCVALISGISIFDQIGRHFQILLPFAYKEMHSTDLGLLIERNCDPSDDSSLPVLFALTHPTREISPIIFKSISRNTSHSIRQPLTYSMPSFNSIVCCHSTLPYCLMYNSNDLQHSIWRIRSTTPEELEEFGQAFEESTANTFANHQSSCSFRTDIYSHSSLNLSSRQKSSLLHQSSQSSIAMNFSPRGDFKSRPSMLGSLAASRLGVGCGQMTAGDININATNVKSFNSAHTLNTISTPNRNKLINYLRDNIEEPILPELTLEQIWVEPSNSSSRATKFFSVPDLVGGEFIIIVLSASSQILVTKCERRSQDEFTLGRTIPISGLDAAPMTSMNMMIVIDTNKNFVLYSGLDRVTNVTVPQPIPTSCLRLPHGSSSPAIKHSALDMSPIQSSSARKRTSLGERSSVGSDLSFNQIFHALSPVPHAGKHEAKTSSPICSSDVRKIEHVIGQSVFVIGSGNQRARLDIPSVCQTIYVKKLLHAMKQSVSKDLGLLITTKWFQTRRSTSQPDIMKAPDELNLFKSWFLSCIGLEKNPFSLDCELELSSARPNQFSPSKKSRRIREIEVNPIITNIYTLFYSMHLVFEDFLVMKLNYEIAANLAELLLVLACVLHLDEYQDYYWLKFPHLQQKFGMQQSHLINLIPKVETLHKPWFFCESPPSVTDFIFRLITLSQFEQIDIDDEPLAMYPSIDGATEDACAVISLFCEMFNIPKEKGIMNLSCSAKSHTSMNISLKTRPHRSIKADERVVELMISLGKDKNYLSRLPEAINLYLWDALLNCRESPPSDWSEGCFNLIGRMDLVDLVRGRTKQLDNNGESEDETLKLLFPDDIRVSEAHRMLASDSPIEFSVVQKQGATEEEHRDDAHRHLYLLNIRTMAMPVGRGAISLRTYSPVIGESFEVPRLDLSGRALSEDRPIEYNHDISVYPWPFFHNGVAAGLTICASSANNIIDSTWINYNRPRSNIPLGADIRDRDLTAANTNNEHAGFLFALGLNGHLEKLSLMALHDYLCQNNDLTKLAILLGMSAAKRGSRDTNIIKVLSIHVDALLPPNSTELDVSAPVHAASIIGVGLLYQSSGDSHISRVLLEEIGRLPGPEANSHVDRESYSLSAGLAFGLVNLCKGGSITIASSDQLRLYMLGGKRKPLTATQKERYFKQDCHRGEEEYINTHITSPGGTLGLGLMYHRSENESVANWMRAPDTQTLLEYVRPDFLILRMLSYGLIMWSKIEPSEEYINRHMPKIVAQYAFRRNPSPTQTDGIHQVGHPTGSSSTDYELISQAYCNIIAGCCMAIALKFAGTANPNAYKTIHKHTKMLIMLSNKPALAEQAGRPCIESCLNVLVTSLAVVMSGTGDLGVMRVCRYLRSRLTQSCVFYGSYMAIHMALGILFLGACRYSLSTSPESIGALVCALYPIYPNHSSDNRYHLQALRHLYVLAAEPRLLIPLDILTNKPVYVNITVTRRETNGEMETLQMKAPCLMPEVDSIETVHIDDDRYWRIEIKNKEALKTCLFKENGYLSVKQKAHSTNNQLVQNIETYILQNMTKGVMKCRKSSALAECVKEDRVVQYSALSELLTNSHKVDVRFKCLVLEQLRLALTLTKGGDLADKINLLRPLIGEFEDDIRKNESEKCWIEYLSKKKDWTNASASVAYLITLHGLKCSDVDDDLMHILIQ
jgi:anaphase-promoting complex subunit 1